MLRQIDKNQRTQIYKLLNENYKINRDYRVYIKSRMFNLKEHDIIVQEGPGGFIIHYNYLKGAATSKTLESHTSTDELQASIICTRGILKPKSGTLELHYCILVLNLCIFR